MNALRERTSITLTKPIDVPTKTKTKGRAGEIECDEALFDQLRAVRRTLADERNVPAYVIFSDVALREMARSYPTTPAEFRRIPGVGEQKLRDFSEAFLAAISAYLETNERKAFGEPARRPAARRRSSLNDSESETLRRFQSGASIDEIAARTRFCPRHDSGPSGSGDRVRRAVKVGTILHRGRARGDCRGFSRSRTMELFRRARFARREIRQRIARLSGARHQIVNKRDRRSGCLRHVGSEKQSFLQHSNSAYLCAEQSQASPQTESI